MAKKKSDTAVAKTETKDPVSTKGTETFHITSGDINDLKTDEDLLPPGENTASLPIAQKPVATAGKSLSDLNKETKAKMKAEGISTRNTNSESQKKYALSRTATALGKRGWKKQEDGSYELHGHKLSIDPEAFVADVDGYELPLGKDSLKTLDQYMLLSRASAAPSVQG